MDFLQLLPLDVVFNHIFNFLDLRTRVRATLVCRAWRDLVREAPFTTSNLPWLFLFDSAYPIWPAHRYPYGYYLLDLDNASSSTAKTYNYGLISCHDVIGSTGSNIALLSTIVYDHSIFSYEYKIYNPFTRKTTILPSSYPRQEALQCSRFLFSSDQPDCLVAAWDSHRLLPMNLCRPRDVYYWVKGPRLLKSMRDMIFYNGQLYGINDDYVLTYDINLQNYKFSSVKDPRHIAACSHDFVRPYDFYLVESDGELLVVTHTYFEPDYSMPMFEVQRVDEEKGELVEVLDLGQRMLFLQLGGSMSRSGLEPSPDRFFTNNSIYFFQTKSRDCKRPVFVGKFELGSSSPQFHPSYRFNSQPKWVPPPNTKY